MSTINIDENSHRESPSIFTRLKHAITSAFLGAVLAQVIAWLFRFTSIVLWYDTLPFIMYITACALIGGIVGEKFIQTLGIKTIDWFDLLHFRK